MPCVFNSEFLNEANDCAGSFASKNLRFRFPVSAKLTTNFRCGRFGSLYFRTVILRFLMPYVASWLATYKVFLRYFAFLYVHMSMTGKGSKRGDFTYEKAVFIGGKLHVVEWHTR